MIQAEYLEQIGADEDCPICGWDAATIHTNIHRKRCRQWQKACDTINYTPMTRPEAKEAIVQAREEVTDADTAAETLSAAMELVRALYDRSLAVAIANTSAEEHPEFWRYVSMLDLPEMPEPLRNKFPHEPGHMALGCTIWQPPGSRMRRLQFRNAERRQSRARSTR